MPRLLLVRHGITEFNITRRFAGYTDIDLPATGCTQAECLRDRLATEKIDFVYCSDLKRAMSTAEIALGEHQIPITTCPELREIHYGLLEGMTFQEISSRYPEVAASVSHFTPQLEFPGGESFPGVTERVSKFTERLKEHAPTDTILIVSHGGPLRTLVCHLLGIDQQHWWQMRFDNASLSIIEVLPQRAVISLLNDTSHLKNENKKTTED